MSDVIVRRLRGDGMKKKLNEPSERVTIRLNDLVKPIAMHMILSGSNNQTEWIRGAIEFRLKYDTLGAGEISQPEERGGQQGGGGLDNMHNVSLLSAISSRLDDFQNTVLTDNEMMIRLMLQVRSIITDGIGRVVCENPNINTQGLSIMDVAKNSVDKSKEFVEKHRGR